jgi:thioredoxin-related protein
VNAYPTLVYLDEKGEIIAPISGYRTPQQLEMHLRFFKEKWTRSTTQTEWDAFQKTFVPTFR